MAVSYAIIETLATTGSGTTTCTFNKPGDIANGDLYLMIAFYNQGSAVVSAESGWSLQTTQTTAGVPGILVYTKVITNAAGEPSTWTWTITTARGRIAHLIRISGADTGSPVDGVTSNTGTSATHSANAISPATSNAMLTFATAQRTSTTYAADPATFDRIWFNTYGDGGGAASNDVTSGGWNKQLVASGSTGSSSVTGTNIQYGAVHIAFTTASVTDAPELRGRPFGLRGANQMRALLAR